VVALTAPDRYGDFIALAVTSVRPADYTLEVTAASIAAGALPRQSWVRLDKVFTLSEGSVAKGFGAVTPAFLLDVLEGLCKRIGYSRS